MNDSRPGIAEPREVKRLIQMDDGGLMTDPAFLNKVVGASFIAAIVNQYQLSSGNGAVQRQDAPLQQLHLVPKGNHDADMAWCELTKDLRLERLRPGGVAVRWGFRREEWLRPC